MQADPPLSHPAASPGSALRPARALLCSLGQGCKQLLFQRWPRVGDSFPFSFPGGQGDSKDPTCLQIHVCSIHVFVRGKSKLRLALGCCWVSDARLQWQKTLTLSFSIYLPKGS